MTVPSLLPLTSHTAPSCSLTDDEMRKNYEQYGHPDGKQDFSQGIALPAWVVDPANTGYVMGAYALLLGVMLPFFVGRWWYGTRKLTKDGILNSTATTFFHGLKEESTFGQMVDLLASADEYVVSKNVVRARRKVGKAGQDEYARLASVVREHQGEKAHGGWEGYNGWTAPRKRARVLITAHLLRVPINDAALLRESQATVTLALPLAGGMSSFALAHNWLACSIGILRLQQFIIQAVHPSSSPLLQLPHVNDEIVQAARQQGVYTVQQFGRLTAAQADKLLPGVRDDEKKEIVEVAKHWPVTDFIGANFQVVGEKTVTPGSIVSFVVKLKLNLPGRDQGTSVANGSIIDENSFVDTEDDGEQSIDELIGRRPASEEGLTPTPFAHAPHFPRNRKPTWHLFVGDHKLNRVFVQPTRFTDVGPDKTRTVRVTFPAPPGPGLYTFQVYLMSDAFVGTDAQKDMRMKVEAVEEEGEESDAESDSISEPDEDSLAGQMALIKGQGVKRSAVHGEESEEESGSEGESGTEESGSEEEEEEEESGSEVTTDDDDDEMVTTSDSDSD